MQIEKLTVGKKFGTEHFTVECQVKIPETLDECNTLAIGNRKRDALTADERTKASDFILQMFVRGWRIWCQEQSGARDFIGESTVKQREAPEFKAAVQRIIDNADPLSPAKRSGRPAKPAEVNMTDEVKAAMQKGDTEKLRDLLAAQGVKINFTK